MGRDSSAGWYSIITYSSGDCRIEKLKILVPFGINFLCSQRLCKNLTSWCSIWTFLPKILIVGIYFPKYTCDVIWKFWWEGRFEVKCHLRITSITYFISLLSSFINERATQGPSIWKKSCASAVACWRCYCRYATSLLYISGEINSMEILIFPKTTNFNAG